MLNSFLFKQAALAGAIIVEVHFIGLVSGNAEVLHYFVCIGHVIHSSAGLAHEVSVRFVIPVKYQLALVNGQHTAQTHFRIHAQRVIHCCLAERGYLRCQLGVNLIYCGVREVFVHIFQYGHSWAGGAYPFVLQYACYLLFCHNLLAVMITMQKYLLYLIFATISKIICRCNTFFLVFFAYHTENG